MNARVAQFPPVSSLVYLSRLLLQPPAEDSPLSLAALSLGAEALKLSRDEFDDVLSFAHSNHVVVRGLERILTLARGGTESSTGFSWRRARFRLKRRALPRRSTVCMRFVPHFKIADMRSW